MHTFEHHNYGREMIEWRPHEHVPFDIPRYQSHYFMERKLQRPHFRRRCIPQYQNIIDDLSKTMVYFNTGQHVLNDLFEHIPSMNPSKLPFVFIDVACAPGGFSQVLLDMHTCAGGLGVTLDPCCGGFPMLANTRYPYCKSYHVTYFDLLEDPLANPPVPSQLTSHASGWADIALADAQVVGMMPKGNVPAYNRALASAMRRIMLVVNESRISFYNLRAGGNFVFRLGASKRLDYTVFRLICLFYDLFATVKPFKSEVAHRSDLSFYIICENFDRQKYFLNGIDEILCRTMCHFHRTEQQVRNTHWEPPTDPSDLPTSMDGTYNEIPTLDTVRPYRSTKLMLTRPAGGDNALNEYYNLQTDDEEKFAKYYSATDEMFERVSRLAHIGLSSAWRSPNPEVRKLAMSKFGL